MGRCRPCTVGHHAECTHTLRDSCDCFVCIATRIGDETLELNPDNIRRREPAEFDEDIPYDT